MESQCRSAARVRLLSHCANAIRFCLYLRDVLAKVSAQAKVQVDGFFDDINVSGEPVEVMKAFALLQQLLPEVGLAFNTAKSHFAYFHEADGAVTQPRSRGLTGRSPLPCRTGGVTQYTRSPQ